MDNGMVILAVILFSVGAACLVSAFLPALVEWKKPLAAAGTALACAAAALFGIDIGLCLLLSVPVIAFITHGEKKQQKP